MSESNRIFSDWTQRCSGISHITSSAVTITETQLANLEKLQQRVIDSMDNPKLALTDNMKKDLAELKAKRDAPDELPKGAITHLNKVFNKVFWKKERLEIDNKYTDKGKLNQEDVLDLHSKVDGGFYRSSDNTVTFNKTTDAKLRELGAGETGEGSISFSTLHLSKMTICYL